MKRLFIYTLIIFHFQSSYAQMNDRESFQIIFENGKSILTGFGDSALKVLIEDLRQYEYKNVILYNGNNFAEERVNKDIAYKRFQLILDSLEANCIELNRVFVDLDSQKKNNYFHGISFILTSRSTNFEIIDSIVFNNVSFSPEYVIEKSKTTIGGFIKENYSEFEFNHMIIVNIISNESLKDRILKSYSIKERISKHYKISSDRILVSCDGADGYLSKIVLSCW